MADSARSVPKLSDTQLVIMSAAAARDGLHVLPTPISLTTKGAALSNALKGMLSRGLIEEIPAARDDVEWRRDEGDIKLTLILTDRGLAAIGVDTGNEPIAAATEPDARKAAGDSSAPKTVDVRQGTKAADVIRLLKRKRGASISELMTSSGWQAHSVRGFLSGTCRKKLGLSVISEKSDTGERRYRIEA